MKQIAVYGKGGIGKSTIAANISVAFSVRGKNVLQIGCDPKHDSTRLLMNGRRLDTVLDYIRTTGPLDYRSEDILGRGVNGIGCIEAGGPKPGVGCAGRGIITAFELIEKLHIKKDYDVIVYDVLGDVVCGGFAVPIRREYADVILIVTSGEYMSLYAANNILRGIENYDDKRRRVAGLIYNSRNVTGEDERVRHFAEAVRLPVIKKIPRDDAFAKAEREQKTVMEYYASQNTGLCGSFFDIADRLIAGTELFSAHPLTDGQLEELTAYGMVRTEPGESSGTEPPCGNLPDLSGKYEAVPGENENSPREVAEGLPAPDIKKPANRTCKERRACSPAYEPGYLSKNIVRNEPLHGCAFNGAVSMSVNIRDAAVLAHSPKSCIYLSYQTISSTPRRRLYERGVLMGSAEMPNLFSTEMDDNDVVFGAADKVTEAVKRIGDDFDPRVVIIVSSCPSGIIGDDVEKAAALSSAGMPVVTIKADGNLSGDYLQGMLMTYTGLAEQIIDPSVVPEQNTVNIIFEKVVCRNTEANFRTIKGFLDKMNVRINCRFLCNTSYDMVKSFCAASLNLLAYRDYTGNILKAFFENKYGCKFFDYQFPVGFSETVRWLRGVGAFFGRTAEAERIIEANRAEYDEKVRVSRSSLRGKRLLIITYNSDVDWIIGAALDCGIRIVKICKLNFSQDEGFRTTIPEASDIIVEDNYDRGKRAYDIKKLKPDIVLSNYESAETDNRCVSDTIPMCPDVGFFTGIDTVMRWGDLLGTERKGEWENDKYLFDKYYSG